LDPIEKAIRNAFAKGNAEDRAFREKVYRSAFAALDRALQANPGITVESAIKRRKAMQARITEIESEFLPAVPAVAPEMPGNRSAPPVEAPSLEVFSGPSSPPAGDATRRDPSMGGEESAPPVAGSPPAAPDFVPEPVLAGSSLPGPAPAADSSRIEVSPDRDERRARQRRLPLGSLSAAILVLAIIGGGVWWAAKTGLLKAPVDTDTGAPAAEDTASGGAEAPLKPGQADQEREWITVFSPGDPSLVSAPSDAKAEVMKDDTGSFLRVRSGTSGAAVSFDVGQGILEKLAGKHAVFDILARSEEGKEAQMALDCNFGDFGDCGRRRYAVGHERNEYLFDVQFPDKQPGSAGTIAISSDFEGQGRSVDIYEIRVSVAE